MCDCTTTWSSKTSKIQRWSRLTVNLSLKPNQIRQNCIDWIKIFLSSSFLYFLSSKSSSLFLKNWQNHWRLVQIDSDWIISWSWTIIHKWNRQKVIIVKMTLFYLLTFKVQFPVYISICINLGDTLKHFHRWVVWSKLSEGSGFSMKGGWRYLLCEFESFSKTLEGIG